MSGGGEVHTPDYDQQRAEWEAFVAAQHAKGRCEFSGMRVSQCVRALCDCFETPEGAAEIEREADGHVCAECPDCIHDGSKCRGCYDGACCKDVVTRSAPAECICLPELLPAVAVNCRADRHYRPGEHR